MALDLRLKGRGFDCASFNDLGHVIHAHVPLSPSTINWYWSKGGDALRLGR